MLTSEEWRTEGVDDPGRGEARPAEEQKVSSLMAAWEKI